MTIYICSKKKQTIATTRHLFVICNPSITLRTFLTTTSEPLFFQNQLIRDCSFSPTSSHHESANIKHSTLVCREHKQRESIQHETHKELHCLCVWDWRGGYLPVYESGVVEWVGYTVYVSY